MVESEGFRNIDFFGCASDDQLAWFYSNCVVYVFPSFMEGFGLPPLEAMRHGAPVVSSNATCLPEVLGDAALYFHPSNTADMVGSIQKIMDDKTLRRDLVAKGKKQVNKYSWERMAQQTLAGYDTALDDN